MDIASLTMGLSQMKVVQQASVSVMKMAMNTGQTQMNDLLKIMQVNSKVMEQSVNPHVGGNLDIKI